MQWARWYNPPGYLWSARHNNLCLTSLSAYPNGIPILYSLYYRFYIVKVVDERRDISLGQSAFYIWGKLCWFVRGSGRELSSLGLLMPTLLILWVGGRRLSHNAALWLWGLSNFSDWDRFPKLYTSCSRSPRGSQYLIDPEGDWMGGCGFLSRVDLPGPGALSVSFLGSRFLWFFCTRENCHYIR